MPPKKRPSQGQCAFVACGSAPKLRPINYNSYGRDLSAKELNVRMHFQPAPKKTVVAGSAKKRGNMKAALRRAAGRA